MRPICERAALGALAAAALLAASNAAQAVVIMPIVSNSSAAVGTFGFVSLISDFALDVQETDATVAATATNVPLPLGGGAETADGAAEVSIDTADINKSQVKSKSSVSTADASVAALQALRMLDFSVGSLSATLSTAGLAPGDNATVDLQLNVSGSLIYTDPSGNASTIGGVLPDMSANVSVLLAIADRIAVTPTSILGVDIPDPLPFQVRFNGSAVLQSTTGVGTDPILNREGDWAGPARSGDFTTAGTCNATFCQWDIMTSILFQDVQSFGFGETFDVGLVLFTNAEAISDQGGAAGKGRSVESNFFQTANFEVSLALVPSTSVPEPGTLFLMAVGLAAFGVTRRGAKVRGR